MCIRVFVFRNFFATFSSFSTSPFISSCIIINGCVHFKWLVSSIVCVFVFQTICAVVLYSSFDSMFIRFVTATAAFTHVHLQLKFSFHFLLGMQRVMWNVR